MLLPCITLINPHDVLPDMDTGKKEMAPKMKVQQKKKMDDVGSEIQTRLCGVTEGASVGVRRPCHCSGDF